MRTKFYIYVYASIISDTLDLENVRDREIISDTLDLENVFIYDSNLLR